MSTVGWIILLVLLLPMIGFLIWWIIVVSVVRIPSGSLGLLMVKGRATDTTLLPGSHFSLAVVRRMVEEYPSVELAYRAGAEDPTDPETAGLGRRRSPDLEQSGTPLTVTLGDRTTAILSFTVRFVLVPEQLRTVHERFGPNGIFGIVRDESHRAVRNTLGDPSFGVDSLFGPARDACQTQLAEAISAALESDGIRLTAFSLSTVDLGRTGEVIGATVRARYELDRETAEAATRLARALNDAELEQKLTAPSEAGWRYRETDLWRDLVNRTGALQVSLRPGPGGTTIGLSAADEQGPDTQNPSVPTQ
jgi:hypothetical protein